MKVTNLSLVEASNFSYQIYFTKIYSKSKNFHHTILTGMTLMSETPDPVSLKSLSLSGSDVSRASDLFLRIDFDRLCVSFDPSAKEVEETSFQN